MVVLCSSTHTVNSLKAETMIMILKSVLIKKFKEAVVSVQIKLSENNLF